MEEIVFFFGEHRSNIVDPVTMVLFPNLLDAGGRFPLDHRQLHDLSQLARAGVGEREGVGDSLQHLYFIKSDEITTLFLLGFWGVGWKSDVVGKMEVFDYFGTFGCAQLKYK